MSAAPATDVIDWEFSVDELRTIRDHLPGLVLPAFVPDGAPDAPEVALLVDRGFLAHEPEADADSWVDALHRPLLLTLALQNAASIMIQVSAWQPGETIAHSTAIEADAASHLTMWTTIMDGSASLRVRGSVLDQAWSTLADLVPTLEVAAPVRGTATIGTVASQAVVDAIGRRDPAVLAAVAAELRVPADAVELFRGLSEPVQHGFRVKAFTAERGPVFVADWFGTSRGWLRMSVGLDGSLSEQAVTPELITDSGTVTVTAQTEHEIRTELLGLVAGLVKERNV